MCKRGVYGVVSLTLGNFQLPFGDGLAGYGDLFGQLLLGKTFFLAKRLQFYTKRHGNPPIV